MILIYKRGEELVEVDGITRALAVRHAREQIADLNHDFNSYRCIAEFPGPPKKGE